MKVYIVSNIFGEDDKYGEEIQEVYTHENESLQLIQVHKEYESIRQESLLDIMRVRKLTGKTGVPNRKAIDDQMMKKYSFFSFYDFLTMKGFKKVIYNQIKL